MAAGEVKNISQIMAQTVRKLEGGSTFPEPGIEALKPACDVVVVDAELPSCIRRTQPQKRDVWRPWNGSLQ